MKDLRPIKGRLYIEGLIAEGEHEHQDFKFMISDARKIARSISAFANNGGGRLLIGVKDNGAIAGVRNEEDIYVVEQAAERYCRPPQQVEFTAFNTGQGTLVIRASIAASPVRPVCACDTDGSWRAYYRVADENIAAHPLMVRAWQMRDNASDGGLVFSLSSLESRLLDLLDEAGETGLEPQRIALGLHISQSHADEIIVRMTAIGIISFIHTGTHFLIRRTDAES